MHSVYTYVEIILTNVHCFLHFHGCDTHRRLDSVLNTIACTMAMKHQFYLDFEIKFHLVCNNPNNMNELNPFSDYKDTGSWLSKTRLFL